MTQEDLDNYQKTIARLEPKISMIDRDGALASIAISLKRIADTLTHEAVVEHLHDAQHCKVCDAVGTHMGWCPLGSDPS